MDAWFVTRSILPGLGEMIAMMSNEVDIVSIGDWRRISSSSN